MLLKIGKLYCGGHFYLKKESVLFLLFGFTFSFKCERSGEGRQVDAERKARGMPRTALHALGIASLALLVLLGIIAYQQHAGVTFAKERVFFFDDKAVNVRGFYGTGFNARQIPGRVGIVGIELWPAHDI